MRGKRERIIVRAPVNSIPETKAAATFDGETYSPSMGMMNEQGQLDLVVNAFQFLGSIRLHYCHHCDEEWPVFDVEFPRAGEDWAGCKAGRCESIMRSGFRASSVSTAYCSRCESESAYSKMYSEQNLQHLGERHQHLSDLTWYESLLIARVHPVMSVITLTSTGLLCYAGHVCNYYVKVMEWMKELPSILKDKKWFLIKRRRSIKEGASNRTQKKQPQQIVVDWRWQFMKHSIICLMFIRTVLFQRMS